MKNISPGVWTQTEGEIQIVVNENTNKIGAIMPTGKPVFMTYPETPTIENFIRFREAVVEALKVFSVLNISAHE